MRMSAGNVALGAGGPCRFRRAERRLPLVELTIGQFLVALCMSLGALCFFIWGVMSGMFKDVEAIKMRAYRAEVADDDEQ